MQEQSYTPRLSAEELTKMNAAPMLQAPKPPENMKIDGEQWRQIANGLNTIYKQNQELSKQVTSLKTRIAELETSMNQTVNRAVKEQKKATEQEIGTLMDKASAQVGRVAEKASRRIGWQRLSDSLLFGLGLAGIALPTILVLGLAIFMGWLPLFR